MKPLSAQFLVVVTRPDTGMPPEWVRQRPVALMIDPSAQSYGPPATTPAPLLNVAEYATCSCTAMKPPEDKPETVVCAGSSSSFGSGVAAAPPASVANA